MKITHASPSPEPFDAIVSSVWADEVKADRGVEGQEFFNPAGNFRIYSTLKAAVDDDRQNVYVCAGTYEEDVVVD